MKKKYWAALLLSLSICTTPATVRASEDLVVAPNATKGVRPTTPLSPGDLVTLVNAGGMLGEGLSLSPDGTRFAFEARRADPQRNRYDVAWFVGPVSGGDPVVNVGDGGDGALFRNAQGGWTSAAAVWSPDGRWIAYRRMVDGEIQVWRSSIDGTRQEQLTHNAADVISLAWALDGKAILFTTDAPRAALASAAEAEARDGYRVDDEQFNAFYSSVPLRPAFRLTGGAPIYWYKEIGRPERRATDAEIALWRNPDGVAAPKGMPRAKQMRSSDKGRWRTSWLENRDPEHNRGLAPPLTLVAAQGADGVDAVVCGAAECSGNIVNLGPSATDEIIFVRNDNGRSYLFGWRPGEQRIRKIFQTDYWLSSCNATAKAAICFLETPIQPRHVVSIAYDDGGLRTLADPNPEFGRFKLGAAERLDWKNRFGRSAWGFLVKPVDYVPGRRYPLVITSYSAHSCLRGNTGDEFPTHLFSARGLMVLCFNEFGVNPDLVAQEPDPVKVFVAGYRDFVRQKNLLSALEAAVDILDQRGLIDRQRVGLAGLSAGAEMVQYALVHSKMFAAAAVPTLAFNPIAHFGTTKRAREFMMRPIGLGDPIKPEESWGWREVATSLHIDSLDTPLMVQAADREFLYAMPTAVRAFDANKAFEMFVYPDEHHVKFQPAHRLRVDERYADWFAFWLKGTEDSDPSKAEQYVRWRKMRAQHPS